MRVGPPHPVGRQQVEEGAEVVGGVIGAVATHLRAGNTLGPRTSKAARKAALRAEARRREDAAVAGMLQWIEHQLAGAA